MTPILARKPAPTRTLERLYRHHAGDVYRTALALLRNPQEAEDATQTAFLNAYRALMRGEKPREPRSWMLAIVHNVVRMRNRTLSRRPSEVPFDAEHEPASEQMPVDLEPVLEALARLPLNQRAAIVMREVEGRTYAEIASVMGVTVSAVEALIFRARRNLRMEREALGVLTLAPLPASLLAASGAGVGGIAAFAGSDAVLKAAAVVVASVVVGGAALQGGSHAAAGNDWRSGPAVYRNAPVADQGSSAFPQYAVPAAPRAARPHARQVAHAPVAARQAHHVVVVFTPVAARDAGDSSSPGPHRRVVPMTPKPSPSPMPKPTPDPLPPAGPPTTPPQPPAAQPPDDPAAPPAVPLPDPVVEIGTPAVLVQAPQLAVTVPADFGAPAVQVQAPQLPALPAPLPVLPSTPPLPQLPRVS